MVFNSDPVITVATGNTNTLSGNISGAGDVVLNGGGTLVLSGANTYSGGTTLCGTACGIAGGSSTLRVGVDTVGAPGAITSSAIGTGTLTFDGGTLQAGGNYTIATPRRSIQPAAPSTPMALPSPIRATSRTRLPMSAD